MQIHTQQIKDFQKRVNSLLSKTGSTDSFKPDKLFDTSLIVSQPSYLKLKISGNSFYLLDKQKNRIDFVDINQKSIKNLSQDELLSQTKNFFIINKKVFIQNKDSIYRYSKTSQKWIKQIDLDEKEFNIKISDIKVWNNFLYILDSNTNSIWKLNSNSKDLSSIQKWTKDRIKGETITSMAINGNIWLLSQQGKIHSFLIGHEQDYPQNVSKNIKNAQNLTLTPDTKFLAFSSQQNLIFIYNQKGESLAKYNLGKLKVLDMAIYSKDNSLLFLGDDHYVYKINL